jgi:hypothetical protein
MPSSPPGPSLVRDAYVARQREGCREEQETLEAGRSSGEQWAQLEVEESGMGRWVGCAGDMILCCYEVQWETS